MTPQTLKELLDYVQWEIDHIEGVRSTPPATPFTVEHLPDGYRNAYQYLNVPRRSTRAVIGNAYRKMSRTHHPDRAGGSDAKMLLLTRCYKECLRKL